MQFPVEVESCGTKGCGFDGRTEAVAEYSLKSLSVGFDSSSDLAAAQNLHHFSGFVLHQLG